MPTLLKAHLLKTDDPFIMLKCYLEDILKEQGLTWKDLVDALKREAGSKKLYDKLPFSPELKNGLKKLMEADKDGSFFDYGKLVEQKVTRPSALSFREIDPESEGEDWLEHPTLRGKATSGKKVRQDPRLKRPERKKKGKKTLPIEEGGGYEPTKETEEIVEIPPKGAPKITGRPKGAPKTTTELGDDPMHPNVREKNIRNFIDALKLSPEFKEHPALTKVINGLQEILNTILQLEDKEPSDKRIYLKPKGKKKYSEIDLLKTGLTRIKTILGKFEVAMNRGHNLDFEGALIYDTDVEDIIFELIGKNKEKANLRAYADKKFLDGIKEQLEGPKLEGRKKETLENKIKLLEDIYDILNKKITYPSVEGKREETLLDAIFYVYSRKTGVVIVDMATHEEKYRKIEELNNLANKKGITNLIAGLEEDPKIAARMKARKERKEREERKEGEEAERRAKELRETGTLTIGGK